MMPFEELTESQRAYRLEEALKLSEEARKNLYGIGMQKERTVHSVLKFYLEPDSEQHEIPIGSFIADIYHRDPPEVLEIQTANFGNLRKKLDAFLQEMPVTVIYPIPWHKWVYWSDPEIGEVSSGHKSAGALSDLFVSMSSPALLLACSAGCQGISDSGWLEPG